MVGIEQMIGANYERLGFVVDSELSGSGTAETHLGIIDVKVDSLIPGLGNLILPVDPETAKKLTNLIFTNMEDE